MNWYKADFSCIIDGERHEPDSEFFQAEDDKKALEEAKRLASEGIDYVDVGHVVLTLEYLSEVDDEFWEEKRMLIY